MWGCVLNVCICMCLSIEFSFIYEHWYAILSCDYGGMGCFFSCQWSDYKIMWKKVCLWTIDLNSMECMENRVPLTSWNTLLVHKLLAIPMFSQENSHGKFVISVYCHNVVIVSITRVRTCNSYRQSKNTNIWFFYCLSKNILTIEKFMTNVSK